MRTWASRSKARRAASSCGSRRVSRANQPSPGPISAHGHDFSRIAVQRSATSGEEILQPDSIFRMAVHGPAREVPYRKEMESAFGQHFADVRAWVGRREPMMLLGANAATRGTEVVFGDSSPSKEVVAHELAHVVQNRSSRATTGPDLTTPSHPTEVEAARIGSQVAAGRSVAVETSGASPIAFQKGEQNPAGSPSGEIPSDLLTEIEKVRSGGKPSEDELKRIGQLAVARMGAHGVIAAARKQAVPGAERRKKEVGGGAGIKRQSPGEAAAATAGTMWWLTLVDGPLPIGDIIYGALIVGAAATAALTADAAIKAKCGANLETCLENPWQPDWNKGTFGPRKDCGACYRECVHALGIWPDYKCPR